MWIAEYTSEHYTFTAAGVTRVKALVTLRRGLRAHAEEMSISPDWYYTPLDENASVYEIHEGDCMRDRDRNILGPDRDALAGQLSAVIDEDEDGRPWTGEAAELADKVRELLFHGEQ